MPGNKCSDIAKELNAMYAEKDLLQYRSFGYGHSFGVLCHYYGREAGLELREDCETVLEPGMVVSMEPMITIPEGMPGAGGYREHDILVITEDGNTQHHRLPLRAGAPDREVAAPGGVPRRLPQSTDKRPLSLPAPSLRDRGGRASSKQ